MTNTSPEPPAELSADVVDAIEGCSSAELEALAQYAEALAAYRATSQPGEPDRESTDDDVDDETDSDRTAVDTSDRPERVPAKASTTIKEINGNRYYYWQWRDGDQVRSQYKGPVESDSEN